MRRRADRTARMVREGHDPPCWDCGARWLPTILAPAVPAVVVWHDPTCPLNPDRHERKEVTHERESIAAALDVPDESVQKVYRTYLAVVEHRQAIRYTVATLEAIAQANRNGAGCAATGQSAGARS